MLASLSYSQKLISGARLSRCLAYQSYSVYHSMTHGPPSIHLSICDKRWWVNLYPNHRVSVKPYWAVKCSVGQTAYCSTRVLKLVLIIAGGLCPKGVCVSESTTSHGVFTSFIPVGHCALVILRFSPGRWTLSTAQRGTNPVRSSENRRRIALWVVSFDTTCRRRNVEIP